MSQPARAVPRTSTPRTTARATPTHDSAAPRSTARSGAARATPARATTARATGPRTTTGPVHVPRSSSTRRTGPITAGAQLRLVPPAPARAPGRSRARRPAARTRRAPFVVLLVGLLVATTLGLLLLNTAIAVDSLQATQQRVANAEQAEQVARLEQQVVAADTAAELARAAAAAGLVQPGAAAHLVLQPDGTSVVVGSAVPAPVPEPPTETDGPSSPTPGN
ncbi:hypothetical protein [uncultured Modestobacter sp.]|uniref:hypothetical protein n=1 Tax=uncultured Modestobacter sp. TaxID=380048 RepID=UPI0026354ABB|nr:hypothetical protein [uncultured Modestobacter sp.]